LLSEKSEISMGHGAWGIGRGDKARKARKAGKARKARKGKTTDGRGQKKELRIANFGLRIEKSRRRRTEDTKENCGLRIADCGFGN
jgi:hypothetical protein